MPKPPLVRSNGDDRRQRRKQGGAVGAAASRMRATAKQTLGAATRAVARRRRDGEVLSWAGARQLQLSMQTKKPPESQGFKWFSLDGAAIQIRTGDLILTKDALYQLSYSSKWRPGSGSNRRPPA